MKAITQLQNSYNPPSLLQQLKFKTHDVHQQLHQHAITCRLTGPDMDLTYYHHVLKAFYGFYQACEVALTSLTSYQPRCTWLQQDLNYYGIVPDELPYCIDVPPLQAYAQQLGFLYVIEGSSLGGQVIAKNLRSSLHVTPNTGGRFFFGYGKNTARRWQESRQNLARTPSMMHSDVIHSACTSFSLLAKWLDKYSQEYV